MSPGTPSPKISPGSVITSPMLMPMRKATRRSASTASLRVPTACWMPTAHATASTTLANSASSPSPVDFTIRPRWATLLLGVGAMSVGAAKAAGVDPATNVEPERVPQQSAKSLGELLVWTDAGRIFVSEAGRPAEELRLGQTAEAAALRDLLL